MKNHITPVCTLALLTILLTACTMKPVHVEPRFPKGPVAIRLESPSISIGDTIVLHEMAGFEFTSTTSSPSSFSTRQACAPA